MTANLRVDIQPDPEGVARATADRFAEIAEASVADHGEFRVALSGGSTPIRSFELLAGDRFSGRIDWSRTQVFMSDERFVPPDSPESNFGQAKKALLSKVPIPERCVHPVPMVDVSPEESARLYEEEVRRVFEIGPDEMPSFDLILLGLGPDGHTASLFPGTEALAITDRLVAANFVTQFQTWRITFTYPLINAGDCVLFQVQGEDKAGPVAAIFTLREDLPASRVRPSHGELIWILDEAAAGQLPPSFRSA